MVNMLTCWERFPIVWDIVLAMVRKETIIPIVITPFEPRLMFLTLK